MATMPLTAPTVKPANPNFSSGPCAKRPGWTVEALSNALVGRSHRSKPGKARIQRAIDLTRELLQVPETHEILFMQGGATGQFALVPMNLLPAGSTADYIDSGAWGKKAIAEAKKPLIGAKKHLRKSARSYHLFGPG